MANVPISSLPAAGALTGTEVAPVVQGANTVKATLQAIADLAGGAVANVVQRFAQIAAADSAASNPTITMINSAAAINDGDSLYVYASGSAEEGSAPSATIQIDFKVNGLSIAQAFFLVGSQNSGFLCQSHITRNGASLDCTATIIIGRNTSGSGSPTVGTHINIGSGSVAYAGNLAVEAEFSWGSEVDPFVAIDSGFAQIMRAA